jgi:methyl-accepting chemotaxis protein
MSIAKRLTITLTFLVALTLITTAVILRSRDEARVYQATQEQVVQQSDLLVKTLALALSQGITDVNPFVEAVAKTKHVADVRVRPSSLVKPEGEASMDTVERNVLTQSKPVFVRETFNNMPVLRAVEPVAAGPSCITCHNTAVGNALATISIRYSLSEIEQNANSARALSAVLVVGSLLVLFVAMYLLLTKHVLKDIQCAEAHIQACANGDITRSIDSERKDEIGRLYKSMAQWQAMMRERAEAARQLAEGNLDMNIAPLSDNDLLGKSLETIAVTLRALDEEVIRSGRSAAHGEVSSNENAEHFNGRYRSIIVHATEAVGSIADPLRVLADYTARLSAGEIAGALEAEHPGDLGRLAKSLREWTNSYAALVSDSLVVADAIREGRLSARTDLGRHKGEFRNIAAALNEALDAALRPVAEGTHTLQKIALGEFTAHVEGEYPGDHQHMVNAINSVCSNMTSSLGDARNIAEATTAASGQICANTEELAVGAEEQSSQIHEIASAMEEMSSTITESASVSAAVLDMSKEVKSSANDGVALINALLDDVRSLGVSIQNSSTAMMTLGELNEKIVDILDVIDDIADQTNMLALNAAIEAARAGEAGRGFSVVADEVRKLAERTARATKEVAEMIKQIRSETQTATADVYEGVAKIDSGITAAERVEATLQGIADIAAATSDAVEQIASGAEEQASTASQISRNVAAISNVTEDTSSRIAHVAEAAEQLHQHTRQLENALRMRNVAGAARTTTGHALHVHAG